MPYGVGPCGLHSRQGWGDGLSKPFARLVEVYAAGPQVQERLTQQIADALVEYAGARGVIAGDRECEHLRCRCAASRSLPPAR